MATVAAAVAGALTVEYSPFIVAVSAAGFPSYVKMLPEATDQQLEEARRRAWVSILGAS